MTDISAVNHEHPELPPPRVIWPVPRWPAADQELWARAWRGDGPEGLDDVSVTWSPRRRRIIEDAYGRFLSWLHGADPVQLTVDAALRVTPESVAAFTTAMRGRDLAPVSVAMQIGALSRMMCVLAPWGDWSWLRRRSWRLKCRAKPRRDKRSRVVPSIALYALGIELMDTATDGARGAQPFFAASQYRDGLMVALLAARPLRIRNFQDLEFGKSLTFHGGVYSLVFDEGETKSGRPIDVYVPGHLAPYLELYLRVHRKVLAKYRSPGTPVAPALWLSKFGVKMEEAALRACIMGRTRVAFGHAINPHLFRDCLATSFATDDPEHVRCIAPILGHANMATMEKHYNHATMLTAVRRFSATALEIRYRFMAIFEDLETRRFLTIDSDAPDGRDDDSEGGA